MSPTLRRVLIFCALTAAVLAGLHALGVRRSTSIVAGVAGTPLDAAFALVYVGAWFWTILITPVLVLAAVLLAVDRRLRPQPTDQPPPEPLLLDSTRCGPH